MHAAGMAVGVSLARFGFAAWIVLLGSALVCGPGRDAPAPAAGPGDVAEARALADGDATPGPASGRAPTDPEAAADDAAPGPASAREPADPRASARSPDADLLAADPPDPDEPPPTHFEGREIAQTMSWLGAGWLTRPERDAEEDATRLHEALALQPGQTACDVGAGSGYHTLRLARAVGPTGRVLAVDLQPKMLELLRERVAAAGLANVETIEATDRDPRLPDGACDLVLLVDVYHELAWPEPMLAAFRRALAPGGRLALVEFRAEDPDVPIKRLHKLSKAQIDRELLPRGFRRVESFDGLPWQHLVLFARDDAPAR
jgi:ubiquinone/menaquinone biosynthesis C-methylase UbiE